MTDVTRRFRAASTLPYSQAIVLVAEYARTSTEDFSFGPLNVSAMVNNGLTITGPAEVVKDISDLLEREVPGLYAAEA